jgi:hypothetical protein
MTPLVSNKVQLFTVWRDILKEKPSAFHFLKKKLLTVPLMRSKIGSTFEVGKKSFFPKMVSASNFFQK